MSRVSIHVEHGKGRYSVDLEGERQICGDDIGALINEAVADIRRTLGITTTGDPS